MDPFKSTGILLGAQDIWRVVKGEGLGNGHESAKSQRTTPLVAICIPPSAASFVNKVRKSFLGGHDLIFLENNISCHDHEYGVINLFLVSLCIIVILA